MRCSASERAPTPSMFVPARPSSRPSRRTSPSSRPRFLPSWGRPHCKPCVTMDGSSRGRKCLSSVRREEWEHTLCRSPRRSASWGCSACPTRNGSAPASAESFRAVSRRWRRRSSSGRRRRREPGPTARRRARGVGMSVEGATRENARSRFVRGRLVGAAAIAFAVSWVIENAVLVGAKTYGAPIEEVLAYYEANRVAVAISTSQVALYLPLLLLFVTGLHGLVQRRGGAGADWSRLAVAAGATLSAVFALVMTTHIAVVLAADGLAEPTPAFEMVWQLHAAAFALAMPALGATFIGAALATHASGLTRPWQRLLGVAGGSLLILAGSGNLAIADGSPLLFVGVLGYAAWLVWLVVTGLRLIRGQG